jgi:pseudouridine-5'-phosphate glycosidase
MVRAVSTVVVAPDVLADVVDGRPVVALETTVVTHGLPHPQGLEVAAAMEAAVRDGGACPATIGILDGAVQVGLSAAQLARLAGDRDTAKVNLGNLAACLARGAPGSTTVAATVWAARQAGIRVCATGGIGGVHRGEGGDVSADLPALARLAVAVVCSGAKAVLDLPRTVEALETLGVPVYGWRTPTFPAFDRRDSGLRVDARFDTMAALAFAVGAHLRLGLGGVVVANPVPEGEEVDPALHEDALAQALAAAESGGVRGREVTPFLLQRMRDLTGGATLRANRALLLSNARLAGQLAAALAVD